LEGISHILVLGAVPVCPEGLWKIMTTVSMVGWGVESKW